MKRISIIIIIGVGMLSGIPTIAQTKNGVRFNLGMSYNSAEWNFEGPSTNRFNQGTPKGFLKGSIEYVHRIPETRWQWKVGLTNIPLVQQVAMGPLWESPQSYSLSTSRVQWDAVLLYGNVGYRIYHKGSWDFYGEGGVGLLYSNPIVPNRLDNNANIVSPITPEERGGFLVPYGVNSTTKVVPQISGGLTVGYMLPWQARVNLNIQGGVGIIPLEISTSSVAYIESNGQRDDYQFSLTNRGNYAAVTLGYEIPLLRTNEWISPPKQPEQVPFTPILAAYANYGLVKGSTALPISGWQPALTPAIGLGLQLRQPLSDQWTVYAGAEWNTLTFQAESTQPDVPFQHVVIHSGEAVTANLGAVWSPGFLPEGRAWNVGLYSDLRMKVFQSKHLGTREGFSNGGAFNYTTQGLSEPTTTLQMQSGVEGSYQFRKGLFVFGRVGYTYLGTLLAAHVTYETGAYAGEAFAYTTNQGLMFNLGVGLPLSKKH